MTNIVEKIKEGYLISRPTAIDVVYELIDEELLAGRFDNAKEMIREIIGSDLPIVISMCAWTISRPYKEILGDVWTDLNNKIPDEKWSLKERGL